MSTHQRAGVLSLVYVVSYLALGLPAVIAGYLVTETGGVLSTAKYYAVAVMALAAVAIPGAVRQPRHDPAPAPLRERSEPGTLRPPRPSPVPPGC